MKKKIGFVALVLLCSKSKQAREARRRLWTLGLVLSFHAATQAFSIARALADWPLRVQWVASIAAAASPRALLSGRPTAEGSGACSSTTTTSTRNSDSAYPGRQQSCRRLSPVEQAVVLCGLDGFSFKACSWMMFYHLGVCRCLKDAFGDEGLAEVRFGGASSGALMAAALATGIDLASFRAFAFDMVEFARGRLGGPCAAMSELVGRGLEKHLGCTALPPPGRLVVSVTCVDGGGGGLGAVAAGPGGGLWPVSGHQVSAFASHRSLIDTLLASCYIPLYYEAPCFLAGLGLCLDGGFTDMSPRVGGEPFTRAALETGGSNDGSIGPGGDISVERSTRVAGTVFVSPRHGQPPPHFRHGDGVLTPPPPSPEKHGHRFHELNREPYPLQLAFLPTCRADYEVIEADGYTDAEAWIYTRLVRAASAERLDSIQ
jgi:hypothetical protein